MVARLPSAPPASERVLLYRQLAEAATQSASSCRDPEMAAELCKQASEWEKLVQEAQAELHCACARPFMV